MKEVVSEMGINITSSTKLIMRQNKFQMSFLYNLVFKQSFGHKIIMIEINC